MSLSKKNNRIPLLITIIALATSLALSGCGGGEEAPKVSASTQPEIPLTGGDRWLYTLTTLTSGGYGVSDNNEQLIRITDTHAAGSITTAQVDTLNPSNLELSERHFLRATASALEEHFPNNKGPYGQSISSLTLLPFPLVAGKSIVTYDWSGMNAAADYDGDGVNETIDEKRTVTVVGTESISTTLGDYPLAWKTSTLTITRLHYSRGQYSDIAHLVDEWIVSGIGLVRRNMTTTYTAPNGFFSRDEAHFDLTRFNVGGKRSEQQAPKVLEETRQPIDGSSSNDGWAIVTLSFDETIDVSAITNDSLTVVNASGKTMPGKILYTDRKLSFYPSTALPSGHYTVHALNIPDVIGNTLDHHEWSFNVDTSAPTDPQNLLPLSIGNRWIYDVSTRENYDTPIATKRMDTVSSTAIVQGNHGVKIQQRDPISNALLDEYYLQKSASSLTQLFPAGSAPYGQEIASLTLMHLPIYSGTYKNAHWPDLDSGQDYDGDGVNDRLDITITTTVGGGTEYVTVPAGSWSTAVRVSTEQLNIFTGSKTGANVEVKQTEIEWLVPNIGVVQRTTFVSAPNYLRTTNDQLTAYRTTDVRSEYTPPWMSEYSPSPQGTRIAPTTVNANFTEAIDLGLLPENAMRVVNSAGQTVAGTLSFSSQQLLFTADHALPDDRYSVTVADISDLLGNTLTGPSWAFTVDTTRPRVLSSSLASGATNVATGSTISFTFSEPVFTSQFITLKTANGANVDYSIQPNGNTVTIVPDLLDHGTTYTLTLTSQIQDAYGNTLATPYSITFTTPPALLQTPAVAVYDFYSSFSSSTTAIGDVNDDGRNDLVVATGMSTVLSELDSFTLHVFLQKADGSLAAPLKTKMSDVLGYGKVCIPSGIGIGDVTGDGKTDIMVGEEWCGIKIFERVADGSWPRPEPITTTNIHRIKYIDMNGDGRKDVVGFNPNNSNQISIWYRQAAGGLGAEMILNIPAVNGVVTQLHDMNNDGLTDIFVNLASTGQFGIMTQRNDHSFNSPVYYSGSNGHLGAAVPDLNNDGLHDIAGIHNTPLGMKIAVFHQNTDGSLQLPTYYTTDFYTNSLFVGDINNDGRNDILTSTNGRIGLYLQDNSGLLKEVDEYAGRSIVAVGDLNNDGKDDVVTMYYRAMGIHYSIAP